MTDTPSLYGNKGAIFLVEHSYAVKSLIVHAVEFYLKFACARIARGACWLFCTEIYLYVNSGVQSQKAVTAYFSSEQLPPFAFARQNCIVNIS